MEALYIILFKPFILQELIECQRDSINLFEITYLLSDKLEIRVQFHITLSDLGLQVNSFLATQSLVKCPYLKLV